MGQPRLLAIPFVMFFILACGLTNGIQQIQSAVTQLPGVLTSMPTAMGALKPPRRDKPPAIAAPPQRVDWRSLWIR